LTICSKKTDVNEEEKVISKKIKGFSIAMLGVCCFLTAGLGFKKANAAAEQIGVTSLVTSSATTTVSQKGLTVQSNETYEGEIKGVFEMGTNLALDFTWLDETAFYAGNFGIRITDASNADNYFDVVWKNNSYQNKWTAAQLESAGLTGVYTTSDVRYTGGLTYVQWGDEIRSANPTNSDYAKEAKQAYPSFTRDPSIQQDGRLQLVWDKDASGEDILIVTVGIFGINPSTKFSLIFSSGLISNAHLVSRPKMLIVPSSKMVTFANRGASKNQLFLPCFKSI
jgi:hypothetical protein